MVNPDGIFQNRFTCVGDTAVPENPVGALGTVLSANTWLIIISKILHNTANEKSVLVYNNIKYQKSGVFMNY
jgi:hypothetical protein